MAARSHLRFDLTRNSADQSAVPENPIIETTHSISDYALLRLGHFKFSKWPLSWIWSNCK